MADPRPAGTVAPVVALGGIVLATGLDPSFSWTGDALSHLGVRPQSALAFNASIVLGGVLGLVYSVALWRHAVSVLARVATGAFAAAMVAMAGVGVFVAGHPLHFPAALAFYLLFTLGFVLDGLDRRDAPTGRTTLGLAAVHVAVWAAWIAGLRPGPGLALPEFAGALLLTAWVWGLGPVPASPAAVFGER